MKVDLKKEILDAKGEALNKSELKLEKVIEALAKSPTLPTVEAIIKLYNDGMKPVLLGDILYGCLSSTIEADKEISLSDKIILAKLSHKIITTEYAGFEFTSEEIIKIKERMPKVYLNSNLLVAYVCELLEGRDLYKD